MASATEKEEDGYCRYDTMMKPIRILEEALQAGLDLGLPGFSVAITSPSCGKVEVTAGEGIDHSSVFCIGSITKTFVAVVILQLVEEGRLDLDKSAGDYINSERHPDVRTLLDHIPNALIATVRHMLSHQSGIPTWEFVPQWIRDARGENLDPRKLWSATKTLSYVIVGDGDDAPQPVSSPGDNYSYSNTNYTVLGHIVEAVTGNTIENEIRQRILVPLGLSSAFLYGFDGDENSTINFPPRLYHYVTPTFQHEAGVSQYFDAVDLVGSRKSAPRPSLMETTRATNLSCEWAAGGLCMTMKDLRTMGMALASVLGVDDENDDALLLLKNAIMFQYRPPRSDRIDFDGLGMSNSKSVSATGEEYCLGICHSLGSDIWHHGGLTLSFSSRLMIMPSPDSNGCDGKKTIVTCATNVGLMHSGFEEGSSPWDDFVNDILTPAVKRFIVESQRPI